VAYGLHCICGYGLANGIIYSPLYSWAFIALITYGIDYLYKKINKDKLITVIICILIFFLAIHNFNWLGKINNYLKDEEFAVEKTTKNELYHYIKNGEYYETFFASDAIYRTRDGKKIVDNIDVYNHEEDSIVGLINDSRWFKIYYEDNIMKLNLLDNVQEIENEEFYIFGMGLREKFILTNEFNGKYKLIKYSNEEEIIKNLTLENIDYINYIAYLKDEENNKIKIYENEQGIYIESKNETIILDDSVNINIPSFEEYEHKEQLKMLFNEVMVNVTKEGPKPNFIAYDEAWYRDAAAMAMVLEETNNIKQIEDWINNIDKIYDEQNGVKEADNLGQLLYLLSLSGNKNYELINKILEEAEKLRTEEGYINGITDGAYHPVYQTKWLIYGMKRLGLDYSKYKVPNISDSYGSLIWFDNVEGKMTSNINDRWQYLYFANLHYNKQKIEYKNTQYPISNEIQPSKANLESMSIISPNFTGAKVIAPHSWSASEMFLYLLDVDRGNI